MEAVLRRARIRHIAVRIVSRREFRVLAEVPTFRGLEGKDPVPRQEFSRKRTEGRESRGESLHDDFSISEIWIGGHPEAGCVSAETGSNPHGIGGRVVKSLVKVLGRPM
jgi:hypothetical protein